MTVAFLSFLIGEIILSIIFKSGGHNSGFKYRFSKKKRFLRTGEVIISLSTLIVLGFFFVDLWSARAMNYLTSQGGNLYYTLVFSMSASFFWMSKFLLGRSWRFKWTLIPLIIALVTLGLMLGT
jgi:hypothetical protein